MKRGTLAIIMSWDDDPSATATYLRGMADRIEKGETFEHRTTCGTSRAMARPAPHDASHEVPFTGRYFGVGYDGEDLNPPVALFVHETDAVAFANGGVYADPDDVPRDDGIVVRCDVVATSWNSCDDDHVSDDKTATRTRYAPGWDC